MSTAKLNNEIKKWLWYILILIIAYVCQTTPDLFAVFGHKPYFIVPVAVAVGVFEGEIAAAAIGAVAGLLWDLSSARIAGLHGVVLCVLCVTCCLLCLHYVRPTWFGISGLCGAVTLLAALTDYAFTFFLFYENTALLLVDRMLPSCLYTLIIAPCIVILCRGVHDKYTTEET